MDVALLGECARASGKPEGRARLTHRAALDGYEDRRVATLRLVTPTRALGLLREHVAVHVAPAEAWAEAKQPTLRTRSVGFQRTVG